MGDEGVKVTVAEEQSVRFFDAEGRDHDVDGLTYGDSPRSQAAVVIGCPERPGRPDHGFDREVRQGGTSSSMVGISAESLQHLGQDEVADEDELRSQIAVETVGLSCGVAV